MTKNIVPRTDGEGSLGRIDKSWSSGFFLKVESVFIAGETINGYRAVALNENGELRHGYPTASDFGRIIGISLNSGGVGERIRVVRSGTIQDIGWTWVVEKHLYVGANGSLTQVIPISGCLILVGYATMATHIEVGVVPIGTLV